MVTAPTVGFTSRSAYAEYTEADVLRRLVHPQTEHPLEVTFVVVTQIMELHFVLLAHEWRVAQGALRADDLPTALAALRRGHEVQRSLLAGWHMLDPMSPVQYNRFRDDLGNASGFQSFGYRELEFLLGVRDENLLKPHKGMPEIHAALREVLAAPSLYDDTLAAVARRTGVDLPDGPATADDPTGDPAGDPAGGAGRAAAELAVWRAAYATGGGAADLAEALVAVADLHHQWRYVHYQAVRRILGDRPGTAGSSGLSWLKRAVDATVFGPLWALRSEL